MGEDEGGEKGKREEGRMRLEESEGKVRRLVIGFGLFSRGCCEPLQMKRKHRSKLTEKKNKERGGRR